LKALITVEVASSRSVDCSVKYDQQIQTDTLDSNGLLSNCFS